MPTLDVRRRLWPVDALIDADLHPIVRRVCAARGIRDRSELRLRLDGLLPIGSLEHVHEAAALLASERQQGRVLIVGDFDADGATSTALMVRSLRALGFAHVDYLVPDRFRFGYGLTPEIVAVAAERLPTLLVTVDNGIASHAGVTAAKTRGIRVLITDHHLPSEHLPSADCIVNPNCTGSAFSSKSLAGVGVAFYVVAALARALGRKDFNPAKNLDLVALGTVADVVPLDRNNRILVEQGLQRLRCGNCATGIKALFERSGRRIETATATDLAFSIAPRLNAAGRLADMSEGVECLISDDLERTREISGRLCALNDERRQIETRMQAEAFALAEGLYAGAAQLEALRGVCLFDPSWHPGVVGLVAGRLKDRLHRPVIAFSSVEGTSLRGSARSIAGVHIRDALESVAMRNAGLIEKFGGHAMAAGLTISAARLDEFSRAFDEEMRGRIRPEQLERFIYSDGELSEPELSVDTARALSGAGPWGQEFPEPVFDGIFDVMDSRVLGGKHLKLAVRHPQGSRAHDAIAFSHIGSAAAAGEVKRGDRVHIVYRLELNEYQGAVRAQLNCRQIAPLP